MKIAKLAQNTRTVDITEKNLNKLGANGATITCEVRIGGLLVLDVNKLLGNAYAYFDDGYKAKRSHFLSGLQSLSTTGDFRGYYTLGTINPGFVAGYMAHVPGDWQSEFGGSVITGQFGLSIITRSSLGPALFAFNPNDLGTNPAPLRPLVYYPSDHPTLGEWDNTSEANIYFNMTTESGGVLFPDSTRSVMFIGSQGFGVPGYGNGTRDSTLDRTLVPGYSDVYYYYDPNRIYKGCHAYPYHYFVWAYNASELANVASGTLAPWSVLPYAVWTIPLPFTPPNARISIGGVGYDANRERVYICQKNADGSSERPIIHVFKLVTSGNSIKQSLFKDQIIPNDTKDSGSNINLNGNIN